MLNTLHVHGFRTLLNTNMSFEPLTIMIGKNGVGKTTILNVVQTLGKFARGGAQRAFGPPPWSLGWQRTKGAGKIRTVDFDLEVSTAQSTRYKYTLKLDEQNGRVKAEEERLTRINDNTTIASLDFHNVPQSGTILRPDSPGINQSEIDAVSSIVTSFESYELNPSNIERGNDPKQTFVSRDGFGVAGYLADLKDNDLPRFEMLKSELQKFRPETESIEVWSGTSELFWGFKDKKLTNNIPAVHTSWGDRQLLGLLCVLFSTPAESTIAIEEIDRGFHPSRYNQVIELLTRAAYEGLFPNQKMQIIITTHSPSFVSKLTERVGEIRLVTRAPSGATIVRPAAEVMQQAFGTDTIDQPLGEAWEMDLLEAAINQAL